MGILHIKMEEQKHLLDVEKYKDRPSQADNLHIDIWVDR